MTSIDLQSVFVTLIVSESLFKGLFMVDLFKFEWKKALTFNYFWLNAMLNDNR